MQSGATRWLTAWLVAFVFAATAADAHDLPLERVMNGFVKIEPQQADVVIRIPLDLLRNVSFPLKGDQYDIAAAGPALQRALDAVSDNFEVWEGRKRLLRSRATGKLAPRDDRSFESYDLAAAQIEQPSAPDTVIAFGMGYLDAHFVYPISSPKSVFSIDNLIASELGGYTKLALRYMPLDGSSRAMMIEGASGRVTLDPPWYEASAGFIKLGVEHILTGFDHLLFLLCLVIPFRRIRSLIPVITAFTVGHSVTLIGTAYGLAPPGKWFPPFIEMAIAVTIVYMALENIVGASLRRRWIIAGLFGLVHGFGFADILSEQLQFAGSNLLVALFSFNLGIEIGQLAVLCIIVPALHLLFRDAMAGRMGVIVVSALVCHTAWHWMLDRGQAFWQTPWPEPTAAGLLLLARWVISLVVVVLVARLLSNWLDRRWSGHAVPAE
jgi:hypothetical protein